MGSVLIGLVPALGWGLQGIVMQKVGGTAANRQMGIVLAALVSGVVVALLVPIRWTPTLVAAAAVNGIPWSLAQVLQIKSFDCLGVVRTMPLTTGMQLIMTSIIGALCFGEWPHAWQVVLGSVGIAVLVAGTVLVAYREDAPDAGRATGAAFRRGVAITALSAALYVAYGTAARLFSVDSFQIILPQALFMFAATLAISLLAGGKSAGGATGSIRSAFGKKSWQNMLTGLVWSVSNITLLFSNQLNGVTVAATLASMNIIVSTLGGLFILHERKTPRELRFVIAGMALVAAGGIAIGVTKL